jgi:hypothetical protein
MHSIMETIYIINAILMSVAISLGVGCSTVAITQFFAAMADGRVDDGERRMMGKVFILLRISMVAILLTMLVQGGIIYYLTDNFLFISPFFMAAYTVVAVLFVNAIGMTMHLVPRSIGPAVQASSWYTLGVMFSLIPLGLTSFTFMQFGLVYLGVMMLTVAGINVAMNFLKR